MPPVSPLLLFLRLYWMHTAITYFMKKQYINKLKTFLNQNNTKEISFKRNVSIDVAKGLLIILLLYNHTAVYSFIADIHDPVANFIEDSKSLFTVFFMQSFFLITGYCSSFNRKFGPFLWRNVKTLVIPAFLLGKIGSIISSIFFGSPIHISFIPAFVNWFNGHGPWFIVTLFFCKLIYWILNRYNYGIQIAIISILYLLGIYCNIHFWASHEYLCYQHVLLMLPFLFIGNLVKWYHSSISRYMPILALAGAVIIPLENVAKWTVGVSIPILDAGIGIPYYSIPLHFFNAITGTALILCIAKKFQNHGAWITRVGTYTLVFYLWNDPIHPIVISLIQPFYNSDSMIHCTFFHFVSFALCVIVSYFVSVLIYETKYLKWLVGKW